MLQDFILGTTTTVIVRGYYESRFDYLASTPQRPSRRPKPQPRKNLSAEVTKGCVRGRLQLYGTVGRVHKVYKRVDGFALVPFTVGDIMYTYLIFLPHVSSTAQMIKFAAIIFFVYSAVPPQRASPISFTD